MTKEELRNYPNVAISTKSRKINSPNGRQIIGKYGVGIWSAIPFCGSITVKTKKAGTSENNSLTIKNIWIDESGHPFDNGKELNAVCEGKTYYDDNTFKEHRTSIILNDIQQSVWNYEIVTSGKQRSSVDNKNCIEKIKWYLSQYAPIEYSKEASPYVDFFTKDPNYKPMRLFVNREELFRNYCKDSVILASNSNYLIDGTNVRCKYLIVTPKTNVEPAEMSGLQIRIKNVAIGMPTEFDVYRLEGRLHGRMSYISGEIEVLTGLDSQINLEREKLLLSPEVDLFNKYFRELLSECAYKVEDLSNTEKIIGAYGYKKGSSDKEIDYGFLKKNAVRPSTKIKIAKSGSTEYLEKELEKTLTKIGYTVITDSTELNKEPISVDHNNKTVTIHKMTSERKQRHPMN